MEQEWERLWAAVPQATPFQSPRWLLPWWNHIGRGTLAAIALRDAATGELIAFAPLYSSTDCATGRSRLLPIGIATSDVLEPLLRPSREGEALARVLAALAARDDEWD